MNVNVYVDGVLLTENYIKEDMVIKRYKDYSENNYKEYYSFYDEFSKALDEDGEYIYTLESDNYFCMGDNRNNSTDSRYFGAVDAKDIQGKVIIHVKHGESLFTVIWKRIFG